MQVLHVYKHQQAASDILKWRRAAGNVFKPISTICINVRESINLARAWLSFEDGCLPFMLLLMLQPLKYKKLAK